MHRPLEGYLGNRSDPTLTGMMQVLATMETPGSVGVDGAGSENNGIAGRHNPVGEAFFEQGYVAEAPKFQHIVHDRARQSGTVMFHYDLGLPVPPVQTVSEAEALVELDRYLASADRMLSASDSGDAEWLAGRVRTLREDLFFIGKQEFEEGAAGIAALWRSYLEKDPDLELIVPYLLGSVPLHAEYLKSQQLLFPAVIRHFAPDDPLLARIHGQGRQSEPCTGRKGMIIMLDDWAKSGLQVTQLYDELRHPEAQPIEVHLLAASDEQLAHGIELRTHMRDEDSAAIRLPVRGYYRAGPEPRDYRDKGPSVTGSHSAVDFGFADLLQEVHSGGPITDEHGTVLEIPVLARIARQKRRRADRLSDNR